MALLEVDLTKIVKNYDYAKNCLAKKTVLGIVLKANAYGLGAIPIAQKIYNVGCQHYYVANLEEAIALKQNLPSGNIYILNGLQKSELLECFFYSLIPVANSMEQLVDYENFAREKNINSEVLLHVNTGMCRLGIDIAEISKALKYVRNINISHIMSHLSCASVPENPMNLRQLELMQNIRAKYPQYKINFANSPAILMGKEYHFDHARLGAGLYGINPFKQGYNNFFNVVKLKAKIIHKRIIKKSEPVSYGVTHVANKGDKIIVVDVGYADSIPTLLSNKGLVFCHGKYLPIIGKITMDMTIIDASLLSDEIFAKIHEVEFISDNLTLEMISNSIGSFNYEMLSTLGARIKRYYIGKNG